MYTEKRSIIITAILVIGVVATCVGFIVIVYCFVRKKCQGRPPGPQVHAHTEQGLPLQPITSQDSSILAMDMNDQARCVAHEADDGGEGAAFMHYFRRRSRTSRQSANPAPPPPPPPAPSNAVQNFVPAQPVSQAVDAGGEPSCVAHEANDGGEGTAFVQYVDANDQARYQPLDLIESATRRTANEQLINDFYYKADNLGQLEIQTLEDWFLPPEGGGNPPPTEPLPMADSSEILAMTATDVPEPIGNHLLLHSTPQQLAGHEQQLIPPPQLQQQQ